MIGVPALFVAVEIGVTHPVLDGLFATYTIGVPVGVAGAGVALVPSKFAETFGFAAAEAMAAGLPVVASRIGALPELVPSDCLVPPDDPRAMAEALLRTRGNLGIAEEGLERMRESLSTARTTLASVYS